MKPMNSDRWIESISVEPSEPVTKFLPIAEGVGRGEGEPKCKDHLRLPNQPFVDTLQITRFYVPGIFRPRHTLFTVSAKAKGPKPQFGTTSIKSLSEA